PLARGFPFPAGALPPPLLQPQRVSAAAPTSNKRICFIEHSLLEMRSRGDEEHAVSNALSCCGTVYGGGTASRSSAVSVDRTNTPVTTGCQYSILRLLLQSGPREIIVIFVRKFRIASRASIRCLLVSKLDNRKRRGYNSISVTMYLRRDKKQGFAG